MTPEPLSILTNDAVVSASLQGQDPSWRSCNCLDTIFNTLKTLHRFLQHLSIELKQFNQNHFSQFDRLHVSIYGWAQHCIILILMSVLVRPEPVYIFPASCVDVLFDSVPCLWSQFLRFVIVSIGPSHLKWAQTRIQMIYLESLGAQCAQVTPITPRGMIVKRKSWQEIFNKLHDISIWVCNIGRVWSLYPHLDPIVITLRNNGTMKRRGSR